MTDWLVICASPKAVASSRPQFVRQQLLSTLGFPKSHATPVTSFPGNALDWPDPERRFMLLGAGSCHCLTMNNTECFKAHRYRSYQDVVMKPLYFLCPVILVRTISGSLHILVIPTKEAVARRRSTAPLRGDERTLLRVRMAEPAHATLHSAVKTISFQLPYWYTRRKCDVANTIVPTHIANVYLDIFEKSRTFHSV